MTALPTDDNGESLFVFRPVPGATEKVAFGTASTRTFAKDDIVRVVVTAATTVRVSTEGGTAATATTDCYMPTASVEMFKITADSQRVAFSGVATGGSAYVSLME
jgi:hypothetical protein